MRPRARNLSAFGGKHKTVKKAGMAVTFFVVLYLVATAPSQAEAARLYYYPNEQEIAEGESVVIELRLDTQGERINAADIRGMVAGYAVQALNLETAGSLFTIFPEAPSVSGGEWSISGGVPGGFAGDAIIAKLAVTAGAPGDLRFSFDANSRVFLHGPEGRAAALHMATSTLAVAARGGDYTRITSASHPEPSKWSFEKNLYLSWQTETGGDYSYKISRLPNERPDGIADLPIGAVKFPNLDDGIFYFSLCKLTGEACGTVSRYRAMIDASPPEWQSIAFDTSDPEGNARPTLSFVASDKNSGVDRYEVSVDGTAFVPAESPFFLPEKFGKTGPGGVVTLKVWDKAGNYAVAVAEPASQDRFDVINIIVPALVLLFILLLMWISIQKRRAGNRL